METLRLTVGDTLPISASYPADITGWTFVLQIESYAKTATITNAASGQMSFSRLSNEPPQGRYDAVFVITNGSGQIETTDPFLVVVTARPS